MVRYRAGGRHRREAAPPPDDGRHASPRELARDEDCEAISTSASQPDSLRSRPMGWLRRNTKLPPQNVSADWVERGLWLDWEAPRNAVAGEASDTLALSALAGPTCEGGYCFARAVVFFTEATNPYDQNAFLLRSTVRWSGTFGDRCRSRRASLRSRRPLLVCGCGPRSRRVNRSSPPRLSRVALPTSEHHFA